MLYKAKLSEVFKLKTYLNIIFILKIPLRVKGILVMDNEINRYF